MNKPLFNIGDVVEFVVQDENGNPRIGNIHKREEKFNMFWYGITISENDSDKGYYKMENILEKNLKLIEDNVLFI